MIHGNTTDQQLTGMVTVCAQLLVKSREQKQHKCNWAQIHIESKRIKNAVLDETKKIVEFAATVFAHEI